MFNFLKEIKEIKTVFLHNSIRKMIKTYNNKCTINQIFINKRFFYSLQNHIKASCQQKALVLKFLCGIKKLNEIGTRNELT